MSQYVERSGGTTYTWSYRIPVCVDEAGKTPGAADLTYTVPVDFDLFWETVASDGSDVRLTDSDGITLVDYQFASAINVTSRALTIEADAVVGAGSMSVLWLYWESSAAVADAQTSFTAGGTGTGYTLVGNHSTTTPHRFVWRPDAPEVTKARPRIVKQAAEVVVVAIAYRPVLARRDKAYGGGKEQEEPAAVDYDVYAGASAQAGMVDKTAIRMDNDYIYVVVKAGTTATDYTLRVTLTTDPGSDTGLARTLVWSATVNVQTLTEA